MASSVVVSVVLCRRKYSRWHEYATPNPRTRHDQISATMIRVSSLEDTIAFFAVLGLREFRRRPDEKGRYTNVFLAA